MTKNISKKSKTIDRKSKIENELCQQFNFFTPFLKDNASEETIKAFDEYMVSALAYLQLSDEDDKYLDFAEEQVRELQKFLEEFNQIVTKNIIENELCGVFDTFGDFLRGTASEETNSTLNEYKVKITDCLRHGDDNHLDQAKELLVEMCKIVSSAYGNSLEFLVDLFNTLRKTVHPPASGQKQYDELIEQGKQAIEDEDSKKLREIADHMLKLKYEYDNNQ